jgi:hypothetical protein
VITESKEFGPGLRPGGRIYLHRCGTVQGSRYRVQGKNRQTKYIFSLCLAPYTIYILEKPFDSDLTLKTRFFRTE